MFWIGFIAGVLSGVFLAIIVFSIMIAAKEGDEYYEKIKIEEDKPSVQAEVSKDSTGGKE